MGKFKDLINCEKSALIFVENNNTVPGEVINFLEENKYLIFKIDIEKNKELCNALKIEKTPTFMLYKKGRKFIETQCDFDFFIDGVSKNIT